VQPAVRVLEQADLQMVRHVEQAGDHVVAQGSVLDLACVEGDLLQQRLADAEGDIALGLELGQGRIDHLTRVGLQVEAVDGHAARFQVDAHVY
jgi:hypothetical protein